MDPVNGAHLRVRHLDALDLTVEDFGNWVRREALLGMKPEVYQEWRRTLLEALQRDGIPPEAVDIRVQGSGANLFSGVHKRLPTEEDLAGNPEAQQWLRDWLGDDAERMTSRPFDSMHKLGLDKPSDYDINISSDLMLDRARDNWDEASSTEPFTKDHGYLDKSLVRRTFRRLDGWSAKWEERTGREMSLGVFASAGPKDSTHLGFFVHFQESDWIVHRHVPLEARLQDTYDASSKTQAGRSFYPPDDQRMHTIASHVTHNRRAYTVDLHGSEKGFKFGTELVPTRDLAALIRHDPGWGRQPIRLISCNTGKGDSPIAQELANLLNVRVYAPTELVWSDGSGRIFVTSGQRNEEGMLLPKIPFDGEWREFRPGSGE